MENRIVDGIAYGGDYSPEQWPEEVWLEDMELMKEAGVNLVSIGIFSWAKLQPDADTFTWDWMDRLMDLLHANGIRADLATATAAPPNWLSASSPDMMAVDSEGRRYTWGSRQSYCPNSPTYRNAAAVMVRAMAERYKDHPALAMWHVNNEYACHIRECCCDTCATEFRRWLEEKYRNLVGLNAAWGTAFWSQHYSDWKQIMPLRLTGAPSNPAHKLDYKRFMSDSLLALYTMERDILRAATPGLSITTNYMAFLDVLDYWKWSRELDIISWDSYPDPLDPNHWQDNAFDHDLMSSFAAGRPYMLMEQAASAVNWRKENGMKPPGLMRFHSWQALAHGADAVMFFQWRQSRRGAEQFHSAMVPHAGRESRTFREVADFGAELKNLGHLSETRREARVGLFMDYECWWTSELETNITASRPYLEDLRLWHRALTARNVPVRFIGPDDDYHGLSLLIVPRAFLLSEPTARRMEAFVDSGGVLQVAHGSGWVDGEAAVYPGGAPGPLTDLLGVTVADMDALPPEKRFQVTSGDGAFLSGQAWREELIVRDAETTHRYSGGTMDGWPAATRRSRGRGEARYLSFLPEADAMGAVLAPLLERSRVAPLLETPEGVYATERIGKDGRQWLFLLNSTSAGQSVNLKHGAPVNLDPLGALVIEAKETV